MCVASTELMIRTMEIRFAKFPVMAPNKLGLEINGEMKGLGEPGRFERKHLDLPPVKMEGFETKDPSLTFNHKGSLGGERRILASDTKREELHPWGRASDLWNEFYHWEKA